MDFTISKFSDFLHALASMSTYQLLHDVDARPEYALRVARLEREAGVMAKFYFRTMHFDSHAEIISAIFTMGHEVGYHYESLTTTNGDVEAAYKDFCINLDRLRKLVPVATACAHGSPRSPWNSQDIWKQYDIHALGIDYEPMLDTDFSKTLYLTDTGRRWDGYKVSVRDKVPQYQDLWQREGFVFHSTDDIIRVLQDPEHPIHQKELLINTHPQRWMPFGMGWMKEAVLQNTKNIVKRIIINLKPNNH